jgi:hypothetical protein
MLPLQDVYMALNGKVILNYELGMMWKLWPVLNGLFKYKYFSVLSETDKQQTYPDEV